MVVTTFARSVGSLTAVRPRRDVWIADAGSLSIIRRGADASSKDLATIIAKPVK
jgi:hypothetical protein